MPSHEEDWGVPRAVTEDANSGTWAEAIADVVLRREVRLVERAEGEESMAVEAPLVV